jgi:hypothetical protein
LGETTQASEPIAAMPGEFPKNPVQRLKYRLARYDAMRSMPRVNALLPNAAPLVPNRFKPLFLKAANEQNAIGSPRA